jgi:hypothetical protein
MRKWHEGAEQAVFKPVPGGYLTKLTGPKLTGRSRNYFVNEAQKAEIITVLRRQRLMMMGLLLALTPAGAGCGLLVGILHGRGYALSPLWVGIGTPLFILFVFAAVLVLHRCALQPLRPLLARLPQAEQRIGVHEQLQSLAVSVSGKVLAAGLISGPAVIIANVLMVARTIYLGQLEITVLWNAIAGLGGVMFTAYFIWLAILRCRLAREQRN